MWPPPSLWNQCTGKQILFYEVLFLYDISFCSSNLEQVMVFINKFWKSCKHVEFQLDNVLCIQLIHAYTCYSVDSRNFEMWGQFPSMSGLGQLKWELVPPPRRD